MPIQLAIDSASPGTSKPVQTTAPDRLTELVGETAMGLGDLVGRHLKLARLELATDVRSLGKRAAVAALFSVLIVIGYTLSMVGLAVCAGGVTSTAKALLVIGLVHLATGAAGIFTVALSRRPRLMDVTAAEIGRSFATRALPPRLPPPSRRLGNNGR